jgi:two-component system response regulator YesN
MDFIHRKSGEQFDLDLISVWDLLEKMIREYDSMILLRDEEDRLVLLIWGSPPESLYRESLKMGESIRRNLSSSGMDTTAVALGEVVPELDALSQSYQRALRALKVAELRGKPGVITYRELAGSPREERNALPNYGKAIAGALKTSNLEDAYRAIDGMIAAFQSALFEIGTYHRTLQLILASILQSLEDLEIPQGELFSPEEDPFEELRNLKTLDEVRSWFANLAEGIVACTGARQENFAQAKVREALDYLETHYNDPELSLQSLCKELYISTSYFSAVLKKYHDKTFVEQLTEIRMRRAMELLRTTGLKTYDISEQVGLRDPHYFSLCFRKYTGVTPTEFRNGKDHG